MKLNSIQKLSLFSFVLPISIFTISCTPFEQGMIAKKALEDNFVIFKNAEKAQLAFKNTDVSCGEAGLDCPSFSGGMVIYTSYFDTDVQERRHQVGVCTQQLIAPDKVLTNAHCVPDEISYEGASCGKNLKIKFPQTKDHAAEEIHCSKVLKVTTDNPRIAEEPDWAILQLARPSSRAPVVANSKGVTHNKDLTLYPVFYEKKMISREIGGFRGTIEKVTCTSSMLNIVNLFYFHKNSSLVTASKCSKSIIAGNSGSGMFNDQMEIVAVGSFGLKNKSKFRSIWGASNTIYNDVFGGSNLHCIPFFNSSPSPQCEFSSGSVFTKKAKELLLLNSHLLSPSIKAIKESPTGFIPLTTPATWSEEVPESLITNTPQEKDRLEVLENRTPVLEMVNKLIRLKRSQLNSLLKPICIKPDQSDKIEMRYPYFRVTRTGLKLDSLGDLTKDLEKETFILEIEKQNNGLYKGEVDLSFLETEISPSNKIRSQMSFLEESRLKSFSAEIPVCD